MVVVMLNQAGAVVMLLLALQSLLTELASTAGVVVASAGEPSVTASPLLLVVLSCIAVVGSAFMPLVAAVVDVMI